MSSARRVSDGFVVIWSSSAKRDLNKLPPAVLAAVLEFARGDLRQNPRRVGKPLERELAGHYAARRGTYRIVYTVNDEQIVIRVVRVRHRADAYR